jgi:hypothetical protein
MEDTSYPCQRDTLAFYYLFIFFLQIERLKGTFYKCFGKPFYLWIKN